MTIIIKASAISFESKWSSNQGMLYRCCRLSLSFFHWLVTTVDDNDITDEDYVFVYIVHSIEASDYSADSLSLYSVKCHSQR